MASTSCAKQSPVPMKEPPSVCNSYPPPLAKYEDIVASPKLFMATLEKFHATMGTKFMIPIIGGKELDLHQLFVEVTSRGGIDKIIKERRWKEVTAIFNFPSTATNASFVLRKYYFSLLHNYERIYFFRLQDALQSPSTTSVAPQGTAQPSPDVQSAVIQQPRVHPSVFPEARTASSGGSPVIGVIDGKIESGYLVTVTIGSEKLKGVLYQAPQIPAHQVSSSYDALTNNSANVHAVPGVQRRHRRKKSEIKRRDPAHPKPNRSGYNFFFAEQHARLKPLHPGKDREISRMIGELWNKLNEPEKAIYQEKALKDKERYRIEMEDYRQRLRTGQVISNAIPLQQRLPGQDVCMVDAGIKLDEAGRNSPLTPYNESSSSESGSEDDKTAGIDMVIEASAEVGLGAECSNADLVTSAAERTLELPKAKGNAGENRVENVGDDIVRDGMVEKAGDNNCGESLALR